MDLLQVDPAHLKEVAGIVETVFKVAAIMVGAAWGWMLFVSKRQRYPRAEISHEVTHRSITSDKVLLNVEVKIVNKGDVLLQLDHAETLLQHVKPLPFAMRNELAAGRDLVPPGERQIEWPVLDERPSFWGKNQFEIEPGECDHIYYDFVVSARTEAVRLETYIHNAVKGWRPPPPEALANASWLRSIFHNVMKRLRRTRSIGWGCATIYDIERKEEPAKEAIPMPAPAAASCPFGSLFRWKIGKPRVEGKA